VVGAEGFFSTCILAGMRREGQGEGWPTPHVPAFVVGTHWLAPGTTTPRVLLLSSQSETMDAYDTVTHTSATAIHTTTLRGRGDVSSGCVRVADDVLDLLWQAPAGTVVTTVG